MGLLDNIDLGEVANLLMRFFPSTKQTAIDFKNAQARGLSETECIKEVLRQNKIASSQIQQVAGFIESGDLSKVQGINRIPKNLQPLVTNNYIRRYVAKTIRSWGEGNNNLTKDAPKLELPKTNQRRFGQI